MRRFFIWSVLAALAGLLMAGAGFGVYWALNARFQPVVIGGEASAEIQRLLDEASWVSDGAGGTPLYVVAYRDSAAAQRFMVEAAPRLRAGGVETRLILFARPDHDGAPRSTAAERATVAELWLTRDWTLYRRWIETPPRSWTAAGIPHADGDLARSAMVEAGRRFDARMTDLVQSAGMTVRYPLVLWRDRRGVLKACACADSRAWAFVRDDLGASNPGASPIMTRDASVDLDRDAEKASNRSRALPYPVLPPTPSAKKPETAPVPPQDPVAAPITQPRVQPRPQPRTAPRPSATPRSAPLPKREEDTTFF